MMVHREDSFTTIIFSNKAERDKFVRDRSNLFSIVNYAEHTLWDGRIRFVY